MARSALWTLPARFFRRSAVEKRLFLEAVCWLAAARLAVLMVPFRRISPYLGTTSLETPAIDSGSLPLAVRISWAVQTAARHTPWDSKCLAQAIAAKMMLRRRSLQSTLYLGLKRNEDREMHAHAWLRCGDKILTGAAGHQSFTVVAKFGDPS